MKSILPPYTFLLFIIVFSNTCYSQNDSVLPNYEAGYNLFEKTIGSDLNWVYTPETVYFSNFNEDDTVEVGYNSYAKIFFEGNKAFIIGNSGFNGPLMYDDSAVVLYNFDLNVGDTSYLENGSGSNLYLTPVIVENITFQNIEGVQRKRIEHSNGDTWIQGIGSLTHPLWPVMNHFEVNYIFCDADLYFFSQGLYSGFYFPNYNCEYLYHIGLDESELPNKKEIYTLDLLGRKVNEQSNTFLIRVFEDGSTQKIYKSDYQ